ncbi:AraC family transcriptional regulator [Leeia oryzae]|uniref:AraC family transcriptional regulator n=1 Tax=Leeia oryzae TaxID=356662 RepID=UPI00035DD87B|nr:AraC family transcriptional regulator [Leeia oryzae]
MSSQASIRSYAHLHHRHAHEHFQLLYCIHGQLQLETGDRQHLLTPGQGVLIPAGKDHDFAGQDTPRCLVLDIPPDQPLARLTRQVLLDHKALLDLQALDTALQTRAEDPLLQRIAQEQGIHWLAAAHEQTSKRYLPLAQLDAWITRHLTEPIRTRHLADLCHLSEAHFRERFEAATGLSPSRYIQWRRLDEANRCVRAGVPVAIAASRCGYQSPSALTAALKKTRGQTPRQLRQH